MSSGDAILIQTIRHLGKKDQGELSDEAETDNDDESFETLASFTTEYVLESVARLINIIHKDEDESVPFKNVKPPPSMSARYNMSAKLAEHISRLGFSSGDEIGYQTLLYANEKDLRNVFMFLIEKMPKEREVIDETIKDSKILLKRRIQSKLSSEMSLFWTPRDCFPSGLRPTEDGGFVRQGIQGCDDFCSCDLCFANANAQKDFSRLPKETRAAMFNLKKPNIEDPNKICSSIIEYNEALKIGDSNPDVLVQSKQLAESLVATYESKNDHFENPLEAEMNFEKHDTSLVVKETGSESPDDVTKSTDVTDSSQETTLVEELQTKRQTLENELTQIQEVYKIARNDTISLRKKITSEKERHAQLEQELKELEESTSKRQQILTLLPEGAENLERLQSIVLKSKEKVRLLRSQWEEHEKSLEQEYQELSKKIEQQELDALKSDSVMKLRNNISDLESEIKKKDALIQKYSTEVKKLKKTVPRSVYTRQIHDLLNQISKQRYETAKIIEDVKSTQKDINLLDGKLYRTYLEADDKVFQYAKSDPHMISVYRSLTEVHKESGSIVEIIRQTGQVKRATRSIQDQILTERSKKSGDKSSQLKRDLENVRSENRSIREKLKTSKVN